MTLDLLRRAALNRYNVILVAGVGALAVATGTWLPIVIGAGAEALWLVLGAGSRPFRRWAENQQAREAEARIVRELEPAYVNRYNVLRQISAEIHKLAAENQGFEASLLNEEMAKLGRLLSSFLQMCVSRQRLGRYLGQTQAAQIEYDIAQCQRALAGEKDPRVQASLEQALSLGKKRLQQHQQIEGAHKALGVQMLTVEKSLDYLKSNVIGMGTREELAKELDGLVSGIASAAELDAYTSDFEEELGPARRAKAARLKRSAW